MSFEKETTAVTLGFSVIGYSSSLGKQDEGNFNFCGISETIKEGEEFGFLTKVKLTENSEHEQEMPEILK